MNTIHTLIAPSIQFRHGIDAMTCCWKALLPTKLPAKEILGSAKVPAANYRAAWQ